MFHKLISFIFFTLRVSSIDFNIDKRDVRVEIRVVDDIQKGKLIGCKYQDICTNGRTCYDDSLFGICLQKNDNRNFIFKLSSRFLTILGNEMDKLWRNGYHWRDFYTQCILQSIIKIAKWRTRYDISHCPSEIRSIEKRSINDDELIARSSKRSHYGEPPDDIVRPLLNDYELISAMEVQIQNRSMIKKDSKIMAKSDDWLWLKFNKTITRDEEDRIVNAIAVILPISDKMKIKTFTSTDKSTLYFQLPALLEMSSLEATKILNRHRKIVQGVSIVDTGAVHLSKIRAQPIQERRNFIIIIVVCCAVLIGVMLVLLCFCARKFRYKRDKLDDVVVSSRGDTSTSSYKDLFRFSRKKESVASKSRHLTPKSATKKPTRKVSTESSSTNLALSWSDDEPGMANMDECTGHVILSYVEKYMKNKELLKGEWEAIQSCVTEGKGVAMTPDNVTKNRYPNIVPYDASRVVLTGSRDGDYVNASHIADTDPVGLRYIAAQSPMENTMTDFWHMIFEQGVEVLVDLTAEGETGLPQYWPKEGSRIYGLYEVNLVSEHSWTDDFLVRNFYLKNLENMETKTVTQFHFFTWSADKAPPSCRSILTFRRVLNKAHRSKSIPILVHCKDGCGKTGTYILLDKILNTIENGLKDLDISTILEHMRRQRMGLVNNEEQFGFVFNAIFDEITTILERIDR